MSLVCLSDSPLSSLGRRCNSVCILCLSLSSHMKETRSLLASSRFLAWLIFRPWRWRRNVPQKHRLTFNGLHGVLSQKIAFERRSIRISTETSPIPTEAFLWSFSVSANKCHDETLTTAFQILSNSLLISHPIICRRRPRVWLLTVWKEETLCHSPDLWSSHEISCRFLIQTWLRAVS
jgi:hypothetical protein